MRPCLRLFAVPLMVAVAASCDKKDPVADGATGESLPVPHNIVVADPTGAPPPANSPTPPTPGSGPPAGSAIIPAALHGRWGLTPGDCTSTRGDAKGLLLVTPTELRFYESRAVPAPGAEAHPDRISGDFHFTGEGQSWTKFETIRASGRKLVRTETNPATSYAYARC